MASSEPKSDYTPVSVSASDITEEASVTFDDTPSAEAPAEDKDPIADEPSADGSASEEASAEELSSWHTPGNTDCEILSDGRMLYTADGYYTSEGGIWYCCGTAQSYLCGDDAMNLNLDAGYIYYSVGCEVRRISCSGGSIDVIYSFSDTIDEMYVIGSELRFLSAGLVYSYYLDTGTLRQLDAPGSVTGLIPTKYGNLYLTGSYPDRSVWTHSLCLLTGVTRCYTDSDYLVVIKNGQTLQISLESLFAGSTALQNYTLHSDSGVGSAMSEEDEAAAQQVYFSSSDFQELQELLDYSQDGIYRSYNSNIASTAQTSGLLTQDQVNIITRARQLAELTWTPLTSINWWSGTTTRANAYAYAADGSVCIGSYAAGKTYQGIPYSQPVYNAGYVGWDISLSDFVKQTQNSSSRLYSETSSAYAGYVGPYYGLDCSGLVSFAWNLSTRRTVAHLRDSAVSNNIAFSLQNLQVGDTLNRSGVHVLLITDLAYDANGNIVSVEVTEQIPPKTRVTCYGEIIPGRSYEYTNSNLSTLAAYASYDYGIFRRNVSTGVSAYSTDAVDLNDAVRGVTASSKWVKNNGSMYYFDKNGNMLTQQWLTYNGSQYYFGYSGKMLCGGWYTIDGKQYYFNSDGKLSAGGRTLKNEWIYCLNNWYYFNSDSTLRTESWLYYGSCWYYFDTDGKMVHGSSDTPLILQIGSCSYAFSAGGAMLSNAWVWADGNYFYFQSGGAMLKSSWLRYGSTWYYLDSDGKMLCGNSSGPLILEINGCSYAFSAGGAMLSNAWVWKNNTYYYFQSGGAMLKSSWLRWGDTWYYMDADGRMVRSYLNDGSVAVIKIGTELYGFSSDGTMQTGWGWTSTGKYYFGSSGAAYHDRWLCCDSYWYYFDSDCTTLSSVSRTIGGASYTFDAQGRML